MTHHGVHPIVFSVVPRDTVGPGLRRVPAGLAAILALTACTPEADRGVLLGIPPAPAEHGANTADLRLDPTRDLPRGLTSLKLGISPFLGAAEIRARHEPIARYLAETLGVPVELVVPEDYEGLIDGVTARLIDVASLPPLSYVIAKERSPGIRLLASQVVSGSPFYSSFILVTTGSPVQSLDELRSRRFAFVDRNSTSGYLYPAAALLAAGIDPQRDFESTTFAGSHNASLELLASGRVDAAAAASDTLQSARARGEAWVGRVRLLEKAGRIPYDALCVRAGFPASGAAKVRAALLRLDSRSAEGRAILSKGGNDTTGWIVADDSRYEPIRQMRGRLMTGDSGSPK